MPEEKLQKLVSRMSKLRETLIEKKSSYFDQENFFLPRNISIEDISTVTIYFYKFLSTYLNQKVLKHSRSTSNKN